MPRRALVVTVVHHPDDARIRHRQIAALLEAGWQVTYVAPWSGHGVAFPDSDQTPEGLRCVDVTRAAGRRRARAWRAARRLLGRLGPEHDVILLHDPELVPVTVGLRLPPVVWDVHEDTAAAVEVRPWLPDLLRRPAAAAIRAVERRAEARMPLLLADGHYAQRFRREHPVVPNTTIVPDLPPPAGVPDQDGCLWVVYLGSITMERGAAELVEVGRALRERSGRRRGDGAPPGDPEGETPPVRLQVIGTAHGPAAPLLAQAHEAGDLDYLGFVPSGQALPMLDGALAGLSLLHDIGNFRPSMVTKVVEYLAHGIPAISTPLPVPAELITRSGGGVIVPFAPVDVQVESVVSQLLEWAGNPGVARELGRLGHAAVLADYDWRVKGPEFVATLEKLAGPPRSS